MDRWVEVVVCRVLKLSEWLLRREAKVWEGGIGGKALKKLPFPNTGWNYKLCGTHRR